jgi:Ribonuclease toxin, BrnT, of type II toxin-antitoxin system
MKIGPGSTLSTASNALTRMQFEWDANKQRANIAKHGIDFATAALVFADPHLIL